MLGVSRGTFASNGIEGLSLGPNVLKVPLHEAKMRAAQRLGREATEEVVVLPVDIAGMLIEIPGDARGIDDGPSEGAGRSGDPDGRPPEDVDSEGMLVGAGVSA